MNTTRKMAGWQADDWARWAGVDAGVGPAKAAGHYRDVEHPGGVGLRPDVYRHDRAALSRALIVRAVIGFGLFAALLSIVPYRLPGETRAADLRPIERPLCVACPASQQIMAAGFRVDRERPWLTVRFAAPPSGVRFDALIGASEIPLRFEQRDGGNWWMSAPAGSGIVLTRFMAGARGDRVVFELPAEASAGAAIRSAEGVRFPSAGTLAPHAAPTSGVNFVDVLIAGLLILGAWRGYRNGALSMATQLVAVAVIVVLLKGLSRALVAASGLSDVAFAFAAGAAIALAGIAVHALARRGSAAIFKPRTGEPKERGLGGLLGIVRTALIAAMLLAILSDQAVLDAVSAMIDASFAGTRFIDAWRALIL